MLQEKARKRRLGFFAVLLFEFRGIDAADANADVFAVHADGDGIAVGHADDVSDENLRFCRNAERDRNQRRQCGLFEHERAPFIFEPIL